MACVWLVAPGPKEPYGASSEDQQAQVDWRDLADEDAVEMSGSSWGVGKRGGGAGTATQVSKSSVSKDRMSVRGGIRVEQVPVIRDAFQIRKR